jgi:hypothetical protein
MEPEPQEIILTRTHMHTHICMRICIRMILFIEYIHVYKAHALTHMHMSNVRMCMHVCTHTPHMHAPMLKKCTFTKKCTHQN